MAVRDDYLTIDQAANELGVTTRTMSRWWQERKGPPRTKVGRSVLYRRSSLEQWLRKNEAVAIRDQAAA